MISIEAISRRGVIENGKKFIERCKTNLLIFGINENESTRPFQAISEKEKTTNRAKEIKELSALKNVVDQPNSNLVLQFKPDSNSSDNELSNRDVEILLNSEISNTDTVYNIFMFGIILVRIFPYSG